MQKDIRRHVRKMTAADLELVLRWRNHPDVRQYMYTQHQISMDEHAQWFDRVSKDEKRHLLIFELDADPLGFIGIEIVGEGGIANWGFYVAPEASNGVGRYLGESALRFAFVEQNLHKLCGQVLGTNDRSIRFHENIGFAREGILRQQHFDGRGYRDVVCFGLLACEWQCRAEEGRM